MTPEPRPMSLNAFAHLYAFDGECTYPTPQTAFFWEPLPVFGYPDARPYLAYNHLITFYDHTGNRVILKDVRCHDIGFPETLLLAPNGEWYQVGHGQVLYHEGRWWMRHEGRRNGRLADMMNGGFQFYRVGVPPHPLVLWWRKLKRRVGLWRLEFELRGWA